MRIYCTPIGVSHVIDELKLKFPHVDFYEQGGIVGKLETEKALLRETYAIIGSELIDKEFLKQSSLKAIARFGGSTDNIDLLAAKLLGIKVYSYKSEQVVSDVANLTINFVLSATIGTYLYNRNKNDKKWHRPSYLGSAARVVIFGAGEIGKNIYDKLKYLKYKNINLVSMRNVMASSNIRNTISNHISKADVIVLSGNLLYWPKDEIMKGFEELKKNCIIINTARGLLVDEEKLYQLLCDCKIGGYFTDVLAHEPPQADSAKLLTLKNVFSTPHIGGYSHKALLEVASNCVNFLLEQ